MPAGRAGKRVLLWETARPVWNSNLRNSFGLPWLPHYMRASGRKHVMRIRISSSPKRGSTAAPTASVIEKLVGVALRSPEIPGVEFGLPARVFRLGFFAALVEGSREQHVPKIRRTDLHSPRVSADSQIKVASPLRHQPQADPGADKLRVRYERFCLFVGLTHHHPPTHPWPSPRSVLYLCEASIAN